MRILQNLEIDKICKRLTVWIGVCAITLIICGLSGGFAGEILGNAAACVIISLYADMLTYALCKAGANPQLITPIITAVSTATKVLLLLPNAGTLAITVLGTESSISWIIPTKLNNKLTMNN